MKPRHDPPPAERGANINLATKARQVEDWLADLPAKDPVAAAQLLADYLAAHNRAEVAAGLRRQLLALAEPAADRALSDLEVEVRAGQTAVGLHLTRLAAPALQLLASLAEFRKRLIAEAAGRRGPLFRQNPLPDDLVGFMLAARRTLDICHACHLEPPGGLWFDLHQIYFFALENSHLDTAVPGEAQPTNLGELYKTILLEAIADPYHMTQQDKLWARDLIARHGDKVVLARARESSQGGVWGVRLDEDRPPQPFSRQDKVLPDCDLVLNTTRLARQLALLASQLEHGGSQVGGLRPPAYAALLQRLKQQWGGSLLRNSPRHRLRSPVACDVLVGFDPLYRQLGQSGDPGGNVGCQVVNESLGGMALECREPGVRLKIGALVCVCRGGDKNHHVGLVRWFKTSAEGVLSFGIKFLLGQPEAVKLQAAKAGESLPGLLLTLQRDPNPAALTLVVRAGGQLPTTILHLTQPRALRLEPEGKPTVGAEVSVLRCRPAAD